MTQYVLSYGAGVDSTAILALICKGVLHYDKLIILHADVACGKRNAEHKETYEFFDWIKEEIKKYGLEITVVQSKEGSLTDYCLERGILPMRYRKWCTDKWKLRPMNLYMKKFGEYTPIIGINKDEEHRARNYHDAVFPLIDLGMGKAECIKIIKEMGWRIPVKSGCIFCQDAKWHEFKKMKEENPEQFKLVCEMERRAVSKLSDKYKGFYDPKRTLAKAVLKRHPETHENQVRCIHCFC